MRGLVRRITALLRRTTGGLRNTPLGLARVKHFGAAHGCDQMAGSIVMTVLVDEGARWQIDPPLHYRATRTHRLGNGNLIRRGDLVTVHHMGDEYLEPWQEIPPQELEDVGDELDAPAGERSHVR